MSIADKLQIIADNEKKVYNAGQNSMIDESKIIDKTATSMGGLRLNDVSELPHTIQIKLTSDKTSDFSGVSIKKYSKNIFIGDLVNGTFIGANGLWQNSSTRVRSNEYIQLTAGTYTLYTDEDKKLVVYVYDKQQSFISAESILTWQPNIITFTLTDTRFIQFSIKRNESDILPSEVRKVVLEKGETITEEDVIVNADGTAKCTSASPNVVLAVETDDIELTVTYRQNWSLQEERKRFWSVYQAGGSRTNYDYAFYGSCWDNSNFKPLYDIVPTSATAMFRTNKILDLAKTLEDCGVVLDTSQVTNLDEVFSYGSITHLPEISTVSVNHLNSLFYNNGSLKKIDKLILREDGSQTFGDYCFNGITVLVDVIFEGCIGSTVSFKTGYKLSAESIKSIMNSLSDTASVSTVTFFLNAINTAFETSEGAADGSTSEEWLNLVATKPNWTISLA